MEEESGGWTRLGVVYSALGTSMIPHQTFQNQWMQEYGAVYCIFCINHQDNTALLWLKMKWIWIFFKSRQLVLRKKWLSWGFACFDCVCGYWSSISHTVLSSWEERPGSIINISITIICWGPVTLWLVQCG